ncbi:MAG: hypothetical protein QNJ00_05325 [Woeseiaceae bacterium]|nr:hypothetical protein [Woeseiaceae bacterium]
MTEPDTNDLPPELIRALKARELPTDVITARVDREVAALAAEHFAAPSRRRQRPAWFAAAAAAIVAVVIVLQLDQSAVLTRDDLYTDVDGSGQIDIADVLALARDGQDIPAEDLDAFAASVVALGDRS